MDYDELPCAAVESRATGGSESLADPNQNFAHADLPTERFASALPCDSVSSTEAFTSGSFRAMFEQTIDADAPIASPSLLCAARTRSTTASMSSPPTAVRRSTRQVSSITSTQARRHSRPTSAVTSPLASPAARKRQPRAANLKSPPISRKKQRSGELKSPPANLKDDANYEDAKPKAVVDDGSDCCICMTCPEAHERSTVDGCDHQFCFDCIAQWSDRENTCPLCKARFAKITRCHPVGRAGRGDKKMPNSKTVKNRDQHSDLLFAGRALEGLLASITAGRGGGVRGFQSGQGFAGRIVFGSAVGGFGSMFAIGEGRRHLMFGGGFDSDEDDDESDFLFGGFGEFSAPPPSYRNGGEASAGSAAAPTRAGEASSRTHHPIVHIRSSRARSVPSFAIARAAATAARSSDTRGARMSIPSMINVQRSAATASGHRDEIGASATRPLEIDDDSDDEIEVVEVARST